MLLRMLRKVLRSSNESTVKYSSNLRPTAMYCYGLVMIFAQFFLRKQKFFSPRTIISMTSLMSMRQLHGRPTLSPKTLQVGLTGSIGMGKSTCTQHFRSMGFPVFDADAAVHELYSANGAAVAPIGRIFPDAIVDAAVCRPILGKKVMEDSSVLKVLEEIVHPLVAQRRKEFFEEASENGHFMVIYDIPLLLENPLSQQVDYVIVATAKPEVQRDRVLARPGMTEEKFKALVAKQMPDEKKRELADFLIHTDYDSYAPGRAQVASIVENIISENPTLWSEWKSRGTAKTATEAPSSSGSLCREFDLVVFDLDDTLVPVWGPIKPAMDTLFEFMGEHMPLTAVDAKESLRAEMMRISGENNLLSHDLTEVRRLALNTISTPFGEQGRVDEALELFVSIRSHVAPHLYQDVIPCLQWLTRDIGVKVAVLTNGNANLSTCSVLGEYVSLSIGACDVGSMKPSPVPFIAISQRTGVPPSRILFVGDSLEKDVMGARAAGMTGALLLRGDYTVQEVLRVTIDSSLIEGTGGVGGVGGVGGIEIVEASIVTESEVKRSEGNGEYLIFCNLYPEEISEKVEKYFQNK